MGSRGVLISCVGGKEQFAANDSIRILTQVGRKESVALVVGNLICSLFASFLQYYEQLKAITTSDAPSNASAAVDISDAIANEVAELKNLKGKLFSYHNVNVYGLIYITLNSADLHPTPSEVVVAAAKDVQQTKQCLSK